MLERLRASDHDTRRWFVVGLVALAVSVPLVLSGPGNDLDVANVLRSGRAIALHLSYVPSRPPGAPVHEGIVGVLDRIGGPVLTNLATLVAAVVLALGLDRLLRREGVGHGGRWAVVLVVANPWFIIAATSTADYVFALAFVVLAALALRDDRAVLAGAFAAASMGCRIGSAVLIAAVLAAELGEGRAARRRVGIAAGVAAIGTIAVFVPSFVAAGGLAFAENDFTTSSPLVQLGRAAAKDLILLGPAASLLALAALPAIGRALRTWSTSWLIRFAVPGLVLSQLLFIRFPWKMAHLLPTLLCGAIVLAVALDERPRLLIALVCLQLVFGVVRLDVIRPDNPNEATGGRPGISTGWGPVVTDWQCRREHPDAYRGRQKVEVEAAWVCTAPFGR